MSQEDCAALELIRRMSISDDSKVIDDFITNGGNIRPIIKNDFTLLHTAAFYGLNNCVKKLIDLGIPVNSISIGRHATPLFQAVLGDREETTLLLLSLGADISIRGYYTLDNPEGQTVLDLARDARSGIFMILHNHIAKQIDSKPAHKKV